MSSLATTKMSSKGQIVIPEEIRKKLKLKTGSRFMVLGENDVVVLKNITPPSMEEFSDLIKAARKQAKAVDLKPSDIDRIVSEVRK